MKYGMGNTSEYIKSVNIHTIKVARVIEVITGAYYVW